MEQFFRFFDKKARVFGENSVGQLADRTTNCAIARKIKKPSESRKVFSASGGARTRDLRRDRPAR